MSDEKQPGRKTQTREVPYPPDEAKDGRPPDSGLPVARSANLTAPVAGEPPSIVDAFAAAYRNLYDKLEVAWNPVEIHQAIAEADRELQRNLVAFSMPGRELERCEATAGYLRLVRSLSSPEPQKAKIAFAYSRYLDELKTIWSRPDIDSIEPRQLAAFGESIAWAAYFASMRPSG